MRRRDTWFYHRRCMAVTGIDALASEALLLAQRAPGE
jgi:hypothetical protein